VLWGIFTDVKSLNVDIVTCRCFVLDLQDEFLIGWLDLLTLYSQNSGLQIIQSYCWFTHTLQFTVAYAIGFSVCTSRILVTVFITVSMSLQITHEVFFSQPNSFLAIILQLSILMTRLNLIPLLPSSYPARLVSRKATLHFRTTVLCRTVLSSTSV
jgi:hypothetical protein